MCIEASGIDCCFVLSHCLSDVTDLSSVKQSAQQVGSLLGTGGLNLLVNNAGVLAHGTVMTTSPEDMQAAFNTNIMGPMNATKVRADKSSNKNVYLNLS